MVNLRYIPGDAPYDPIEFQATRFVKTRSANFHEYSWNPDVFQFDYGAQIKRFLKDPITYSATLEIRGSVADKRAWLDDFHLRCDLDILHQTPGKLYWGDMYIECYIISTSTEPDKGNVTASNEIGIYCPYPSWIYPVTYARSVYVKEQVQSIIANFLPDASGEVIITDASTISAPFIPLKADFRAVMISDSALSSVSIDIDTNGDNVGVDIDFPSLTLNNEYALIVDSRTGHKTVQKAWVPGAWSWPQIPWIDWDTAQNVYNLRGPYSRPFKTLSFGRVPSFNFYDSYGTSTAHTILTIFYERSEPTWIS
ncbi:MAG: hypothetical protein IKF99_15580 [Oscillospiraceae bacterium]|nr:hypothetical protein [Oscillospiraceae bacterium]MBR3239843.1 hypothetical protein [Oscillospiraceae bacterium]